jgi:hypothetical protein
MAGGLSFWVLGMPVMRGYYITFDQANDRVGIIPQVNSSKNTIVYDPAPDGAAVTPLDLKPNPVPKWVWEVLVATIFVLALLVVFKTI